MGDVGKNDGDAYPGDDKLRARDVEEYVGKVGARP